MKLLFKLLLVFSLISCAGLPQKEKAREASPTAKKTYSQIVKDFRAKPSPATTKALEDFTLRNPDLEISNNINLILGDYYMNSNPKTAVGYYLRTVNSPFYSTKEWISRIKAAKILWSQKDSIRSLELLGPIFQYDAPKGILYTAHKLKAEISLFKGNYLNTLMSLVYLTENAKDKEEEDAYRTQATEITNLNLGREDLMKLAGNSSYGFLRSAALFRMGIIYFEESNFGRAESYLDDVISSSPDSALAERASDLILQINSRSKVSHKTIGVILPLSGRLGPIGYKTLSGIQHGFGVFNKSNNGFKIAVIDSEANPSVAQRAVEKLVIEDNVIAILGSLKGATSLAIAKKSQELGVPNIGFSLNADLSSTGSYIFRNALTSHMQVKQLVKTSMEKYDAKSFAILYPNDNYGIEFANIFWDEVLAKGGQVRGVQAYNAKETDFRNPIRRLVGTFYREDRFDEYKLRLQEWQARYGENTRRKIPSDLLPPIVDFDAIFIPDTSKALGQIAPMLQYNDIKTPLLLGTNLWNTRSIAGRAGKFAPQLIFVDTSTDINSQKAKEFMASFENSFGRKPDTYESIAYETARLLKELIQEERVNSRYELQSSLMKLQKYPSVLGNISVNDIGDIERPLKSLRVLKSGEIVDIKEN